MSVGRTVAWVLLFILLIVTLFPFYWMLRTALSDNTQLPGHPGSLLPVESTLGAFKRVLGLSTIEEAQAQGGSGAAVNFWLYLRNSLVVATITTVCQVFFSAMAASLRGVGGALRYGPAYRCGSKDRCQPVCHRFTGHPDRSQAVLREGRLQGPHGWRSARQGRSDRGSPRLEVGPGSTD